MDGLHISVLGLTAVILFNFAYAACFANRLYRQYLSRPLDLKAGDIFLVLALLFILVYLGMGIAFFEVPNYEEVYLPAWVVLGLLLDSFYVLSVPPDYVRIFHFRQALRCIIPALECVILGLGVGLPLRVGPWPQLVVVSIHPIWISVWCHLEPRRLIVGLAQVVVSLVQLIATLRLNLGLGYSIIFSIISLLLVIWIPIHDELWDPKPFHSTGIGRRLGDTDAHLEFQCTGSSAERLRSSSSIRTASDHMTGKPIKTITLAGHRDIGKSYWLHQAYYQLADELIGNGRSPIVSTKTWIEPH
ncbi:hypothetical protein JX266_014397, partial [Neoarthrinium moseri]